MHNSWFVALEGAGLSLDTIAADSAPAPQSTNFLIITAEVSWPTNQLSSGPPEVSSEDIPSVSICPEVSSGKQSFSSSVSTNFSEHSISPKVEVSSTITADVGSVFVVSSELQHFLDPIPAVAGKRLQNLDSISCSSSLSLAKPRGSFPRWSLKYLVCAKSALG